MTNKRGGFTLTETLVAGVILGTALTIAAQLLVAAAAQRKTLYMRQIASIEAGNVMERLAAETWSQLDATQTAKYKLSPQAAAALPSGKLAIHIDPVVAEPESNRPTAKRLTVTVSWGGDETQSTREARLVAWRYEHASVKPAAKTNDDAEGKTEKGDNNDKTP